MNLRSKKGFTLIELIIVIAILGIIALIAIPNLAGIRQRSQVSADIRTAEQIGKAVRIWATDVDAADRTIPSAPTDYKTLEGLCPAYIGAAYTAKSLGSTAGTFYVSSVGAGTNNAEQKIVVGIATAADVASKLTGSGPAASSVTVNYAGGVSAWAYQEQ